MRTHSSFNRRFNFMRSVVIGFIATIWLTVFVGIVGIGYVIYNTVTEPEVAAEQVGEFVGSVVKGLQEGYENVD